MMGHHHHNHELESKVYYDHIAQRFNHSWDGFLSQFFKKEIVKKLQWKKTDSILDVGCANGTLLSMLHETRDFNGFGLDISPEMIKIAQQNHPDFNFQVGSAQALPYENQQFDLVICSASFHHFPNPLTFLEEAKRVLKDNGRLVIAEIRIPLYDVRTIYNRYITAKSKEGDVKVYGHHELIKLFEASDFDIVIHHNHYQIQYYELKKLR